METESGTGGGISFVPERVKGICSPVYGNEPGQKIP